MIIDFHTHAFSQQIVERATTSLSKNSGNLRLQKDGTIGGLLCSLGENGIDYAVVLNIATKPGQQGVVNGYAQSLMAEPAIIPFGSVHPYDPDCLDELQRLHELGFIGIKLHPDYQGFFVDDEKAVSIYEKCGELGLITVFHAGLDIGMPEPIHCTPEKLAKVLPAFGGAAVIAAHLGGHQMTAQVEEHLVGLDIYLDTAYCYSNKPPLIARRIIENHGADRILFGSDFPWSNQENELNWLYSLGFDNQTNAMMLGGNAQRLLALNPPCSPSQPNAV